MKSSKINRRFFVKSGIIAGSASLLPLNITSAKNAATTVTSAKIFIIESGIYGKDPFFVLGLLKSQNNSIVHQNNINDIRSALSYNSQLKYKSNDKFKLNFAKAVIDYFVSTSHLAFTAKVIPFNALDFEPGTSNNQITLSKVDLYHELI